MFVLSDSLWDFGLDFRSNIARINLQNLLTQRHPALGPLAVGRPPSFRVCVHATGRIRRLPLQSDFGGKPQLGWARLCPTGSGPNVTISHARAPPPPMALVV